MFESESEVTQSCPILCNPMDCRLSGFSIHGIFQARVLEWIAISFSRDLPDPGIEPGSPALQADALPSDPPDVCESRPNTFKNPSPKQRCVPGKGLFATVALEKPLTLDYSAKYGVSEAPLLAVIMTAGELGKSVRIPLRS